MASEKEKLLDQTYENLIQAFFFDFPLDKIDSFIASDILIFGSNADEVMRSIQDVKDLSAAQREQAKELNMSFGRQPIMRKVLTGGNSAFFIEELTIEFEMEGSQIVIESRMTFILEYTGIKWHLVHAHISKPVDAENDAFLTEKWKREKEKLENLVKKRTAKLEESLENLKNAQQQLVQQEKLASLGQLTAGIAHEIKNPLNFVNNFSELSVELIEEAREKVLSEKGKSESEKSLYEEGENDEVVQGNGHGSILEILNDIEANLKKINKHGSRADGIVKSMLQHARSGNGEMEPADLNMLIEEYVNLSFHGMRAGENPINVDIQLDLDEKIEEVPLIAEDFSRVIVNLCNNAFDAMREKGAKRTNSEDPYTPKLSVRTMIKNNTVTIEIEDNGPGIPEEMKDKILQPFFTTKKGTEGTGLGLSITNDIVKAHGGTLQIASNASGTTISVTI